MKPDFLAQLAKLDNVGCIKESTGDLSRISAIRALLGDAVTLIAGWESTSLQAFSAGATGWAPVCTNFAPEARNVILPGSHTRAQCNRCAKALG